MRAAYKEHSLEKLILDVYGLYFPGKEFFIEARSHVDSGPAYEVQIREYLNGSNYVVSQMIQVRDHESSHTLRALFEGHAGVAALYMYEHLIVKHPAGNVLLEPDEYDPDAMAISALIEMCGGSVIGRQSPVLKPGKNNPWMLNLPVQKRVVPIADHYFTKPLEWWQRFLSQFMEKSA